MIPILINVYHCCPFCYDKYFQDFDDNFNIKICLIKVLVINFNSNYVFSIFLSQIPVNFMKNINKFQISTNFKTIS